MQDRLTLLSSVADTVSDMTAAALPAGEEARLRDLYDYRVLDTQQEESFDELVRFAAELYRLRAHDSRA